MACIEVVINPHVLFVGKFSMDSAGVLLQSSPSRDWHCQYQRIQRRMVESLTDQSPRRQQNARRTSRQVIQSADQVGTLLFRHPTMQNESAVDRVRKAALNGQKREVASDCCNRRT